MQTKVSQADSHNIRYPLYLLFHCLSLSTWAYENKAEWANQVSNMCGIKNGVNKFRVEFLDSSIVERTT